MTKPATATKIQPQKKADNGAAKTPKLPDGRSPRARLVGQCARYIHLIEEARKRCERWGMAEVVASLEGALGRVSAARDALEALPADWRPARGKPPSRYAPGDTVAVKAARLPLYAGLMPDPSALGALRVVSVSGGLARAATPDGRELFVPRGHLERV